jgi:hypothetical protein
MSDSDSFDIEVPSNPNPAPTPAQPVAPVANTPTQTAVELPDVEMAPQQDSKSLVEADKKAVAVKYGIIGAGQGGSRLADTFYGFGYRRVCAINTTPQDFLGLTLPEDRQLVISSEGGAGKDAKAGENALKGASEEVMNLMRRSFGDDIEHIMVCVGSGGGSGTGAAIGLIKLAKYYMRQIGKKRRLASSPLFLSSPKVAQFRATPMNS